MRVLQKLCNTYFSIIVFQIVGLLGSNVSNEVKGGSWESFPTPNFNILSLVEVWQVLYKGTKAHKMSFVQQIRC